MPTEIRWLIRRDMPQILAIESDLFGEQAWTEEDFLCCLRQRNCIGMVAEVNHEIVGYMIYELHKASLHVLNFAVARDCQRSRFGTEMVERLIDKLGQQQRNEIRVTVRESNLPAQLFFRVMGFRAVAVDRGHHEDTGESGYVMRFRLGEQPIREPVKGFGRNRISAFLETE